MAKFVFIVAKCLKCAWSKNQNKSKWQWHSALHLPAMCDHMELEQRKHVHKWTFGTWIHKWRGL